MAKHVRGNDEDKLAIITILGAYFAHLECQTPRKRDSKINSVKKIIRRLYGGICPFGAVTFQKVQTPTLIWSRDIVFLCHKFSKKIRCDFVKYTL